MAMTVINVNPLSQSSIRKAIKELEAYKKLLKEFPNKYVRALSEYLYDTLNMEAPQMTDHWILNIEETDGKATGIFIFDGICQFVEFGTGVVGMNAHDGINDEWLSKLPPPYNQGYNTGTYIRFKDNPEKSYWVYPKNGNFYSTKGQMANPFIWRSVQELLDARANIGHNLLMMNSMGVNNGI